MYVVEKFCDYKLCENVWFEEILFKDVFSRFIKCEKEILYLCYYKGKI